MPTAASIARRVSAIIGAMSHGDSRRAWAATLLGRCVGARYRLERLIAVGGMGAVYRGRHLDVDLEVAIKTVVPGALDASATARMRREARRAASVGGAGVVGVHDFGIDDVCGPYLVMELLEGETLEARIERDGRLPVDEVIALGVELATTLAAVHAAGLVHRDLKPANLFLLRGGPPRVKILDFGLARPLTPAEDETLSAPGGVAGTPRFMAPEQLDPDGHVGPAADQWALAAVLYTALAGRRPYAEWSSLEALRAAAAGPPRPLGELRPDLDGPLTAVIMRAMAHHPEARFPHAATLAAALEAVQRASSPPTRPDPPTLTVPPREPRHPSAATKSGEARGASLGGDARDDASAGSTDDAEPANTAPREAARSPWPVLGAASLVAALALGTGAYFATRPDASSLTPSAAASPLTPSGEAEAAPAVHDEPRDEAPRDEEAHDRALRDDAPHDRALRDDAPRDEEAHDRAPRDGEPRASAPEERVAAPGAPHAHRPAERGADPTTPSPAPADGPRPRSGSLSWEDF
ncbi:MAG: protein kinase [Sandaracinaceae bacterium]|nr:protein kinase [Sandaracinaceae bacterium]